MTKIDIEPNGRFSTDLKAHVESVGMSLTNLAQEVDSTYEHMRKLVSGRAYPSTHLLYALAKALNGDREEWAEMIEVDRLYKKYKKLPKILGIAPEIEPFQAIIPKLSPQARETLLTMAKTLSRQEMTPTRPHRT